LIIKGMYTYFVMQPLCPRSFRQKIKTEITGNKVKYLNIPFERIFQNIMI
jgi:hypothetical protein